MRRFLLILPLLAAPAAFCEDVTPPGIENDSAIRIRSAPIEGKVFLVSEEQGEDEIPGDNVSVKIRLREERDFLCHIITREDGSYELPKLEPQDYYLFVGDLRLDLKVFPETSARTDLSKVLIIMIPREMADREGPRRD